MILMFIVTSLLLTNCGVHNGLTSNLNNHSSQVLLTKNNFKIVEHVEGTASGVYVLFFGGPYKPLVSKARKKMLEHAYLVGSSKAIINETVEVNYKIFMGIVNIKTVTVSAYIIEFIDY